MQLPEWIDGVQDPAEAKFAATVVVPVLTAVVTTALGVAAYKAVCGDSYKKFDPHNLLPGVLATITAGFAVWSYLNPPPDESQS